MWVRVFVLVALVGAAGFLVFAEPREAELRVVFFDVGQGDSIFIESPTGVQVLVDAGAGSSVLRSLGREMGFFDRTIDMVIATHPDKDHIGGFPDVFERYEVETVLMTENENDTGPAEAFLRAVEREMYNKVGVSGNTDARLVTARAGQRFDLGGGATLEILFPDRDATKFETNTASVVARVAFGDTSVLLTGDAPKAIEEYLVEVDAQDGINNLKSTILKVGHHGSRTSTSERFLKWVDPEYAIISAGKDNRYGHPHESVTSALRNKDIQIYETAKEGNITLTSDGEHIGR